MAYAEDLLHMTAALMPIIDLICFFTSDLDMIPA